MIGALLRSFSVCLSVSESPHQYRRLGTLKLSVPSAGVINYTVELDRVRRDIVTIRGFIVTLSRCLN